MKYYVDFHIHSALSPCSDNDMTPNNIINMALLKGLDIIAVTDHNSAENISAIMECAKKAGILLIPGMEIESREEIHLVCLFPNLKNALKMQELIYDSMPPIKNREDIFGEQLIFNENDKILGKVNRLLLTSCDLSIEKILYLVNKLKGVLIPAHVDRDSNSIISNLGTIPEEIDIGFLEISKKCDTEKYLRLNPHLKKFKLIKSSDAHTLGDILEREVFIELKEKTPCSVINYFKNII